MLGPRWARRLARRALAPRELRYLGLIGSRAKVARIYDELASSQMPAELLTRVHAPIGLDIGAVSPAEIAVAVLGQVVQAFRSRGLASVKSEAA